MEPTLDNRLLPSVQSALLSRRGGPTQVRVPMAVGFALMAVLLKTGVDYTVMFQMEDQRGTGHRLGQRARNFMNHGMPHTDGQLSGGHRSHEKCVEHVFNHPKLLTAKPRNSL